MLCIEDKTMVEIIDGELTGPERSAALEHIRGCEKCAARMRVLVGLNATVDDALAEFQAEQCPAPEVLHAYAEDALSADERAEVEQHLSVCTICSVVLERGTWLAEEYTRQEELLLKGNKERLGSRWYETVLEFLKERYAQAQEMLETADAFLLQLKPVPVFRGKKTDEPREQRLPVVCRSGVVIIAVTGRDPAGLRLKLVDDKGQVIAEEPCSSEGIVTFLDIPAGYYSAEVVEN